MNTKYSKKEKPSKITTQSISVLEDTEIDEIMENIDLKRPRSAYTHFCIEEAENFRKKNKGQKIKIAVFSKDCAKKWSELSQKEKDKYNKKLEDEKIKYKSDLEKVRHYLFKDFNDIIHQPPTAYRIFLNERLREGFEKNIDPKEVKIRASTEWRMLPDEDREIYKEKKKQNDDWFEKAKNIKKVSALSMFVQKTIQSAKEKKEEVPTIAEISPAWKKLPNSEKEKYQKYADDINEEREKLQDIYELVNGVKPKKPAGAFRIFLQEKIKEKTIHNIQEGKELWYKLSEDEKEKYLKKAHTCRIAYKYKKMIFNKKIRKILPKKPGNAYAQFLKEKKGQKPPKGESPLIYWREQFEKLPKDKLKKYQDKAEKEKEKYEKKMKEFDNVVFDMPKRPINAFSLYVKDRIPDLREKKRNVPNNELLKIAAKEWMKEEGVSQAKYEKKAEQDKKRFIRQLKEFEKLGYYKKNAKGEKSKNVEDEVDEEKKSKKTMKKKRNSSASSKKVSKKSKSVNKTQEPKKRSREKSRKKTGKTQKKK